MAFAKHSSITSATIGKPMSLQRGNIDPAMLKLTFIYFEHTQDERGVWQYIQDEKLLVLNQHYRFDKRRGIIKLLDYPLWQREGLWRAPDRKEPLLYKGQVKWPQVILFQYEYYAPEEVITREVIEDRGPERLPIVRAYRRSTKRVKTIDLEETNEEARRRLGYDLPKYAEAPDATPKERGKSTPEFDWVP